MLKMDISCEPSNSPFGFVLKRNSLMGSQRSTCEEDVYFNIFCDSEKLETI